MPAFIVPRPTSGSWVPLRVNILGMAGRFWNTVLVDRGTSSGADDGSGRTRMVVLATTVICLAGLLAVLAACASAQGASGPMVRSRMIGPHTAVSIPLQPRVRLVVPKHTVDVRGRISVVFLPRHAFSIRISVPWHRRIKIELHVRHRVISKLIGGVLFPRVTARHGSNAPQARAALLGLSPGDVCVGITLGIEGLGALVTDGLDLTLTGETVSECLVAAGRRLVTGAALEELAKAIGAECLAEVIKTVDRTDGLVEASLLGTLPHCNEPSGPSGPSDGTPLVVATLTPPTLHGIPLGTPTPKPTSNPPTPTPTPTPARLPAGEFYVQNADGGIYWRSAPDWNAAEATPGNGFYPGTVIRPICYEIGAADVPGSADAMWEQASWVSGPGGGSGWVNEHFIADGQAINQPSPGVPACSSSPPPPPPQTWSEQETPNHPVNTFTNYHNASGMGPAIGAGQWVQVSCKVYDPTIQSVNPDGYWYRIASAPWNNAYYSPANTFMNGDPYGGPYTHNTDFAVPNC